MGVPSSIKDFTQHLHDPLWRLTNLYSIKRADTGQIVPFEPRPEQRQIFEAVHVRKLRRIIILKARRLGMSTGIGVLFADMAAFNEGIQLSIVDQTQSDATLKLNSIVKVAFNSLPAPIRARMEVIRDNDSAFETRVKDGKDGDASSSVFAGKNARGGTNQALHVSEWGPIQVNDPSRSEEILTGALQSAEHGIQVVETTWMGGRGGHLWDIIKPALETPDSQKTPDDWHVFFFPWWTEPTYTHEGQAPLDSELLRYFTEKEAELGIIFTPGQRQWYARKRRELGIFIWREFPTTFDECFRAPIEGAIYADLIDKLRSRGAIRPAEVDGSALVHTFWDIGSPINTVVWYVQFVGPEIRVIDIDLNQDVTTTARVSRILGKGYPLGHHFLPHDAAAKLNSGRTVQSDLTDAGLSNVRVIPRTVDVWIGINRLRQLMPRMTFRLPACDDGINALQSYHTKRESMGGTAVDQPVHDWSSHASDALRQLAEAEMAGMLPGGSETARAARRGTMDAPKVHMGLRDGRPVIRKGQVLR